jgi:hypothetical protein
MPLGTGAFTLSSVGTISPPVPATISDTLGLTPTPLFSFTSRLSTALAIASTTTAQTAFALADAILLNATDSVRVATLARLIDALNVKERLLYIATLRAVESMAFTNVQSGVLVRPSDLSDELALTSPVSAVLRRYATLLDAVVMQALTTFIPGLTARDTVAFQTAVTRIVRTYATSTTTLNLLERLATALTVRLADTARLTDQGRLSVSAWFQSVDGFSFTVRLPQGSADYQAWVMNADNLGVTQYTNFLFDSLARFNNKTYAVAETGLYLLAGDDDDGTDIDAHLLTGMLDFGNAMQPKLCPRAYLYVKSDDEILVETVSDILGQRTSTWYRLTARTDSAIASRTLELNSSEEGTHWAFHIENVDGGTLDLRGLQVSPRSLRYVQYTN